MPWYYRFRLTNWLLARPWRWNYVAIWQSFREYPTPRAHPLLTLWHTITFPHVHHESEDAER